MQMMRAVFPMERRARVSWTRTTMQTMTASATTILPQARGPRLRLMTSKVTTIAPLQTPDPLLTEGGKERAEAEAGVEAVAAELRTGRRPARDAACGWRRCENYTRR